MSGNRRDKEVCGKDKILLLKYLLWQWEHHTEIVQRGGAKYQNYLRQNNFDPLASNMDIAMKYRGPQKEFYCCFDVFKAHPGEDLQKIGSETPP